MPLSQQDIVLGRALLSWGLVDAGSLMTCAQEVQALVAQGVPVTLGQLLVARGLLSVDRYQAIVERLRQQYLQPGASPQMQQATERMPLMSQTGRYTRTFQAPVLPPDETGVSQVVADWRTAAAAVTASGSQIVPAQGAGPPAAPAPAPLPPPQPSGPRPDAHIRRRFKVPEEQERFAIGPWLTERYIAEGNWGIVYRVTRGAEVAPYALKLLKQHEPSAEVRSRFVQEARTMAKLRHPGIAHVHDAGVANGLIWYVMDFLEGPSLKQVFEARSLGTPEVLRVVRELCGAVAYAHAQAILHRDLKPENVIMLESRRPVLTDFGLAKDVQSGLNLTTEGQRIGTPLYMAPELLLDASKATPQSEVYALGTILWHGLTGAVPFAAKSMFDLVDKIEAGKLPALKTLCADAPKGLEKLLLRTLHKEPKRRPQSVSELEQELGAF